MTTKQKHWYVLYTKPRWEKKVCQSLLDNGMEAYCPLNKVTRRWSDRMKTVEEPLFKSYVFLRISIDDYGSVRMTPGVVNFVYWQGKPGVVRDAEIKVIRRFMNEYREVQAEPMLLKPDTKVRIRQGLFMDKNATIIKVEGNKVKLIIESIGYTLIASVSKSNLEALPAKSG